MLPEIHIETHMSHVVLSGDRVYKRLKAVQYPFADYSSLPLRKAACEAELEHNQPWAPGVYLRVAPVAGHPPRVDGPGPPVDYAIVMVRLPDEARLCEQIDGIDAAELAQIGRVLQKRHDAQPRRPASALPDEVERRMWENLAELIDLGDLPISATRLRTALAGSLDRAAGALDTRSKQGKLLHGDLRTEHVYRIDDQVVVLDGVAFNESLAVGDPIEDIAFLAMELSAVHGRWDLEAALWQGWAGDSPVDPLLIELYTGHRSLIRAKIAKLQGRPKRLLRHLLHALARLEAPAKRPMLVGIGGLPGVGKSTLAKQLAEHSGFTVLRTDALRKRQTEAPSYTLQARDAVYDALFAEARQLLAQGKRVVVDASFGREAWRQSLIELGRELGLPTKLLIAEADPAIVAERLANRVNDPSDADLAIYHKARGAWEAPSQDTARLLHTINTEGEPSAALRSAIQILSRPREVS